MDFIVPFIRPRLYGGATRYNGVGYLNEYEYTPDDGLKVKIFSEMTEE